MVHDDAIARILAQDGTLYTSAATLVEAANAAGGRDNISVIVFCPDGSVPAGIEMVPDSQTEKLIWIPSRRERRPKMLRAMRRLGRPGCLKGVSRVCVIF